ncbi:MAG: hypothetical protein HRU35_08290 [Rickettsiaceae bacterium]|nr:hypothetical protein [Rickettsiaceae bacterium]
MSKEKRTEFTLDEINKQEKEEQREKKLQYYQTSEEIYDCNLFTQFLTEFFLDECRKILKILNAHGGSDDIEDLADIALRAFNKKDGAPINELLKYMHNRYNNELYENVEFLVEEKKGGQPEELYDDEEKKDDEPEQQKKHEQIEKELVAISSLPSNEDVEEMGNNAPFDGE